MERMSHAVFVGNWLNHSEKFIPSLDVQVQEMGSMRFTMTSLCDMFYDEFTYSCCKNGKVMEASS